ncbi:predicted protein [Sclerotinia sclerotiorum 1980 UF-70]|uniref:Uncharacterized protein n=1 Tax=Sclerotinia sclerotiorum (strain ATCC 18683 / 1980 / Ss-1) TaxID=665079 RepID=A7FA36_SCLS1|nr:predicted protein [Sclerotinia sclerotiorum 1980 UF-70]EDO00597.1 predicted protein [Sclerotinia sclerotiorum 1980 UF-70]
MISNIKYLLDDDDDDYTSTYPNCASSTNKARDPSLHSGSWAGPRQIAADPYRRINNNYDV